MQDSPSQGYCTPTIVRFLSSFQLVDSRRSFSALCGGVSSFLSFKATPWKSFGFEYLRTKSIRATHDDLDEFATDTLGFLFLL